MSFNSISGYAYGFLGGIYGGRGDKNFMPSISMHAFSASSSLSLTFSGSMGIFSCFLFVLYYLVILFHRDFHCMCDAVVGISADVASDVSSMNSAKAFSLNI